MPKGLLLNSLATTLQNTDEAFLLDIIQTNIETKSISLSCL